MKCLLVSSVVVMVFSPQRRKGQYQGRKERNSFLSSFAFLVFLLRAFALKTLSLRLAAAR